MHVQPREVTLSRCRTLRRDERGSELIEFALVSILLFTLVFGVMEFGRAVFTYGTVAHLAREGARFAMVRGADSSVRATPADADAVETFVLSRAAGITDLTVTTTWPDGDNAPGSVVQVSVSKVFNPVAPLVNIGAITMESTSRVVIAF